MSPFFFRVAFSKCDLCRTYASYLCQRGIDLSTLLNPMGHRDMRMTKRYAHLNVDPLRNAISVLNQSATILATLST